MSKTSERLRWLEQRFNDRDRMQSLEAKCCRLEAKLDALALHLGIKFNTTTVVVVPKEMKKNE